MDDVRRYFARFFVNISSKNVFEVLFMIFVVNGVNLFKNN